MDASNVLAAARVVPVVVIEDLETALPLGETLLGAGLGFIEVTLRTPVAAAAIERLASRLPELTVGAGSVRRADQIQAMRDAGAQFAVSPGSTESLLDSAAAAKLPLVPGVQTASEVMDLLGHGLRLMKFFPAGLAGGTAMLKAIGAPLPEARFFPTGGIRADNAHEYLALPNVNCVGGTWLTPPALLNAGDFAAIGELATQAAKLGRRDTGAKQRQHSE